MKPELTLNGTVMWIISDFVFNRLNTTRNVYQVDYFSPLEEVM